MSDAYIVGAVRSAGGRKNGRLSKVHPIDLGAKVVDALVERTGVAVDEIDDLIWGCVSQVGAQSSNVGRNVCLSSVLGEKVPGTSVDRQCGSGQQAIHFAAQAVMSGTQDIVIAGGVEEHVPGAYRREHYRWRQSRSRCALWRRDSGPLSGCSV